MARFIAWRIVQLPLILAVVYLITFALVWLAPGSPYGNNDRVLSEAAKNDLKAHFHAQSWQQFLTYYPWRIVTRGDFGPSLSYEGWTVNDILKTALPVSMSLGLLSIHSPRGSSSNMDARAARMGLVSAPSTAAAQ